MPGLDAFHYVIAIAEKRRGLPEGIRWDDVLCEFLFHAVCSFLFLCQCVRVRKQVACLLFPHDSIRYARVRVGG